MSAKNTIIITPNWKQ